VDCQKQGVINLESIPIVGCNGEWKVYVAARQPEAREHSKRVTDRSSRVVTVVLCNLSLHAFGFHKDANMALPSAGARVAIAHFLPDCRVNSQCPYIRR
jgi:hypothetical protein